MDLEYYLISQESSIAAIALITKKIEELINDSYYTQEKSHDFLDNINCLNRTIRMITFCMYCERKEYYKMIDDKYKNDLSYSDFMYKSMAL